MNTFTADMAQIHTAELRREAQHARNVRAARGYRRPNPRISRRRRLVLVAAATAASASLVGSATSRRPALRAPD